MCDEEALAACGERIGVIIFHSPGRMQMFLLPKIGDMTRKEPTVPRGVQSIGKTRDQRRKPFCFVSITTGIPRNQTQHDTHLIRLKLPALSSPVCRVFLIEELLFVESLWFFFEPKKKTINDLRHAKRDSSKTDERGITWPYRTIIRCRARRVGFISIRGDNCAIFQRAITENVARPFVCGSEKR